MSIEKELRRGNAALERIADVLERIVSVKVTPITVSQEQSQPEGEAQDTTDAKPAKTRGGKPAKARADKSAGEPLPPPEDTTRPAATKEEVRAALQQLKNREAGLAILGEFGASTLSALPSTHYAAVIEKANKAASEE